MKIADCIIPALLVGMLVMFWIMVFVHEQSEPGKLYNEARLLKEQCEAQLPRNQSCEVAVTAKIKDNKEN